MQNAHEESAKGARESGPSHPTDKHPQNAKRGWYAHSDVPPCRGQGSATVEPLRKRKHIAAIKAVLAERPRDLSLFIIGIHFGLRGSDLLALVWDDVLSDVGGIRDRIEVVEQKTGKLRLIAVQPNACNALLLWRESQQPQRKDFVFPSRKGGRLKIARLHQLVNEWAELAGIAGNYGSHTLRKTFGYHLRMAGVGIETIMKIFGHTSQAVTMRYLGIDQDETDEARLKLSL
jgi:integrase